MRKKYPVGVLVLEKSRDTAEGLVSGLRRSGLSLRPRWVNRAGMLAEFLRGQTWELLLAGLETPVVPPAQVVEVVRRSKCDVALIGIIPGSGPDDAAEHALRAGFHDVVPNEPAFLLEHAVSRELGSLEDRRRARRLKEGLQASTRTLRELIHRSDRAVAFVHGGQILQANPMWMELMSVPAGDDPRGRPLSEYVAAEDREEFSALLVEQAQTPTPMVEIELNGLRADGEVIPLRLDVVPAMFEERAGFLVTARGPAPAERSVATDKPLNDGKDRLVEAIEAARETNAGGAVACILIENQAKLDEVLGLTGRGMLAKELKRRIADQLTADAVVGQVSDDTFGFFLRDVGYAEMREKAMEISFAITRDTIKIDERTVRPACLAGVAAVSGDQASAVAVLEAAYDACRRPVMADVEPAADIPAPGSTVTDYKAIAEELLTGMSDGRLSLIFQPIVRLHGEPIELYEVFIRLKDRQDVNVPTRDVVSAAHQANLDGKLDLWVIRRAIELLEARQKEGRDTHLFVKLSDQCMDDIKIPLTITRELKSRSVSPQNLIVELSETAASGNLKKASAFVQSLQKIGCSTALDHFGLSLSAFQLLEDVPAAYLKLDASLVNRLSEDTEAYNQVSEICRRARDLEKHTIASYLDNPQSLPKLYQAGVEFAQGYYIQEPNEAMDFEFSILVE